MTAPERGFPDDEFAARCAAMQAAMFGGARPPLNPLEPLLPTVGVHFHIAVPEGLQTTTVSMNGSKSATTPSRTG